MPGVERIAPRPGRESCGRDGVVRGLPEIGLSGRREQGQGAKGGRTYDQFVLWTGRNRAAEGWGGNGVTTGRVRCDPGPASGMTWGGISFVVVRGERAGNRAARGEAEEATAGVWAHGFRGGKMRREFPASAPNIPFNDATQVTIHDRGCWGQGARTACRCQGIAARSWHRVRESAAGSATGTDPGGSRC